MLNLQRREERSEGAGMEQTRNKVIAEMPEPSIVEIAKALGYRNPWSFALDRIRENLSGTRIATLGQEMAVRMVDRGTGRSMRMKLRAAYHLASCARYMAPSQLAENALGAAAREEEPKRKIGVTVLVVDSFEGSNPHVAAAWAKSEIVGMARVLLHQWSMKDAPLPEILLATEAEAEIMGRKSTHYPIQGRFFRDHSDE